MQHIDVMIIGGGQAGLATAYHLNSTQRSFLIVDKHARLGDNWRERYDSLVLFASRRYSHIPGLKMSGNQRGYPHKDEVADYLEGYARHFKFPLALGREVVEVLKSEKGYHVKLRASDNCIETYSCSAFVIATGGFQKPLIFSAADKLSPNVAQLTPENYKRPSQLPDGNVLVVGDGATGRQVARELTKTHSVSLATGKKRPVKPQQIFGIDYFWWLDKLGILKANKRSWLGRYMQAKQPFPGEGLKLRELRRQGVTIRGKVKEIIDDYIFFENGPMEKFSAIIWSMGYYNDYSWLKISNTVDEKGELREERGVVESQPGMFCIGKSWQWTRGSATLTGVGDDAKYIAEHIEKYLLQAEAKGVLQSDNELVMSPAI